MCFYWVYVSRLVSVKRVLMTLQSFKQQLVTEVFKCRGCYILKGVTTLCERLHIHPLPLRILLFFFPHDWCNKGRGMCYPVCGMVHIKEPLLLIDKSSLCGGSGFPFSLSEWSLTICLTPYNHR